MCFWRGWIGEYFPSASIVLVSFLRAPLRAVIHPLCGRTLRINERKHKTERHSHRCVRHICMYVSIMRNIQICHHYREQNEINCSSYTCAGTVSARAHVFECVITFISQCVKIEELLLMATGVWGTSASELEICFGSGLVAMSNCRNNVVRLGVAKSFLFGNDTQYDTLKR